MKQLEILISNVKMVLKNAAIFFQTTIGLSYTVDSLQFNIMFDICNIGGNIVSC